MRSKPMQVGVVVLALASVIGLYAVWGRLEASRVYAWRRPEAAARKADGWVLIEQAPTLRDLRGLWTFLYPPITRMVFVDSTRVESPEHPGLVLIMKSYSGIDSSRRETRTTSGFIFDRNSDRYAEVDAEQAAKRDPFEGVELRESVAHYYVFRRIREAALSSGPVEELELKVEGETKR